VPLNNCYWMQLVVKKLILWIGESWIKGVTISVSHLYKVEMDRPATWTETELTPSFRGFFGCSQHPCLSQRGKICFCVETDSFGMFCWILFLCNASQMSDFFWKLLPSLSSVNLFLSMPLHGENRNRNAIPKLRFGHRSFSTRSLSHRIHVWCICLHLVDFYGKCR